MRVRSLRLLPFALSLAALGLPGAVGAGEKSSLRPMSAGALPAKAAASRTTGAAAWDIPAIGTIDQRVFDLALGAANCAVRSGAVADPSTLTVIDYSKPSTEKRLWVFDLRARELVYEELVAHGQGSGDNLARQFSNEPDTHATSLGLFVTADTYVGKNGYSLRLDGLDRGFNDRARDRAIVMHGAPYVNAELARAQGRLGRSWGCPGAPRQRGARRDRSRQRRRAGVCVLSRSGLAGGVAVPGRLRGGRVTAAPRSDLPLTERSAQPAIPCRSAWTWSAVICSSAQ